MPHSDARWNASDPMLWPRLSRVFRNIFNVDDLELSPQMSARDVDSWDSLTHINLIVAIEREFHVHFTTAEVRNMNNVGDLADVVARKLGAAAN